MYYQTKAHTLNTQCNFYSPNVFEYGQFIHTDITAYKYIIHYIIMEYIPNPKIDIITCKKIKPKVEAVDNCLRANGIFHNDLAARNVFYNEDKPSIIDFGQALNQIHTEAVDFNCDPINQIFRLQNTKLPPHSPLPAVTPSPPASTIGGKRKKPHYSKKKKRISKKKKRVS